MSTYYYVCEECGHIDRWQGNGKPPDLLYCPHCKFALHYQTMKRRVAPNPRKRQWKGWYHVGTMAER